MKPFSIFLLSILPFQTLVQAKSGEPLHAQESSIIDPRQYIMIYEYKNKDAPPAKIAQWDKSQGKFLTSRRVLDNETILMVEFDKIKMEARENFLGSLSLSARIGDRDIEVSPYSEIGKKQATVTVQTASSETIVINYLGIINKAKAIQSRIAMSKSSFAEYEWAQNQEHARKLIPRIRLLTNESTDTVNYAMEDSELRNTLSYLKQEAEADFYLKNRRRQDGTPTVKNSDLLAALEKIASRPRPKVPQPERSFFIQILKDYDDLVQQLEFFSNGAPEVRQAFGFLGGDPRLISNEFLKMVAETRDSLHFVSLSTSESLPGTQLAKITEKTESILEQVGNIGYGNLKKTMNASKYPWAIPDPNNQDDDHKKMFADLSKSVKEILFGKILYATIDLEKASAKEGDIIEVNLLWYPTGHDLGETTEDEKRPYILLLARYELKALGWKQNIYDSFLLVDRKGNQDTTNSPSRYKGAPGVSLVWTYSSDFSTDGLWKTMGRLQPSVGMNVSYLDFDTESDLEIGFGPIVGLFRNLIFFSAGYNLHVTEKPWYFAVGFSFANMLDRAK